MRSPFRSSSVVTIAILFGVLCLPVEIVPFSGFAHGFSVPRTAKRRTNSVFGGCASKKKKGFSLFSSFSSSSSSNAGKGDDTIKELNKLDSIVIDPALVIDPAFWDYCLVPNEQGQMRLKVLSFQEEDTDASSSSSSSIDASDLLVKNGGLKDDVSFYQDTYDLFEEQVFVPVLPPNSDNSCSGLVVRVDTLDLLPESITQGFSKIIRVLRDDNDDANEDNDEPSESNERLEKKYAVADIEVSSLGELRALTICSYAYLTKRS